MPNQQKQPTDTIVNIPQFMSEKEDTGLTDNESVRKNAGKLYKLMLGISSIWLLIVIIYITQFFGWSNLFLMMPDEFGGFLAGITLPLAVIWLVMAYIDRGASFKQEAKLLHAYMNQLVYPEDGAAQTTKAMADAIRSQVIELQEATRKATEETAKIKTELGQHVSDFSKLVEILQGYSGTTMNELNEGVKLMSQGLDYINDKVNITTGNIENKIKEFSTQAASIQENLTNVSTSLDSQLSDIQKTSEELNDAYGTNSRIVSMNSEILNNCSAKISSHFDVINNFVSTQSSQLEKVTSKIAGNYQDIYRQLGEKSLVIEQSFSDQVKQLMDYLKNLDQNSLLAADKFEEFRNSMNKEVDSILSRAKAISDSVELKVQDLTGIADTIHQDIDQVEEHIDTKIKNLQQMSQQVSAEIINASEIFENKTKTLYQSQIDMVEGNKVLCDELDSKNTEINTSAQNTQAIISQLCEKLAENTRTAKVSGSDLIEALREAETLIARQSSNLQDISEKIDTQSKLNSSALDQQHKLLNNALAKIENGKDSLKQQMEDLQRQANAIDDEAISAINRMENSLSAGLQKSSDIISRTTNMTEQLQTQTQNFGLISEQAVAKTVDFSVQIKETQNSLEALTQSVVNRAENVASVLEAQVKAVNAATDNSNNKHNKLLELFNQQSSILNNTAENTVQYVADVVQALDEKAETINLLFKNQQNEFFGICDKLSENTGSINTMLKNQINLLEQGSDRVFGRMTGFEEEFTQKATMLTETSNQTIDKLLGVNDILSQQNKEIEKSITNINTKLHNVGSEINKLLGGFSESLQIIKSESSAAGNEIAASCGKLKENNRILLSDSRNIAQTMEGQIKALDNSLDKIKNQSEQINVNLNKQKDSIADVVNLVSTQTRLGEASLAQQYKYLSDAANDVGAKMKEIEAQFRNNTSGIFDTSSKLAFEINTLSDRIIKTGEDVKKVTKQTVSDLESVGISLGNTAENLVDTVNNTNKKVSSVVENYQTHIASFNTLTAEASSGVFEVNNLISQQNDKMIKISEDTKNLVNNFNVVLGEASNQLSKRANGAYEQIKTMSAQLKELGLQLEDSTQLTTKHMNNAGEKMRANINEIAANAERISNDIRTSGEVFLKQSGVLMNVTDETVNKVNKAMEALKNGSDDLHQKGKMWVEQTNEFTKIFEQQSEIIDTTSLKANENLRKLEAKYQEVQTDNFLKDAATLFERMETVAIDINRIFNPTTEEEIWKKYYSGDTAAFVRYLAKVMTKNQIGAIRKEYEDNQDFRSLVNRYVADFEMLISKAKGNERAGVLLSVISGSDVGKVYYVIAKALDKLN